MPVLAFQGTPVRVGAAHRWTCTALAPRESQPLAVYISSPAWAAPPSKAAELDPLHCSLGVVSRGTQRTQRTVDGVVSRETVSVPTTAAGSLSLRGGSDSTSMHSVRRASVSSPLCL